METETDKVLRLIKLHEPDKHDIEFSYNISERLNFGGKTVHGKKKWRN